MIIIKEQDNRTIANNLMSIKNIGTIIETLYKPLEEVMKEKNLTKEGAIDYKEKMDNYLKKYAALTLKLTAQRIEEVIKSSTVI